MTEKRFTVKQRQGATIYSIVDYYGQLPLHEGMYYKSNAEKLCKWLNEQHELLNHLHGENIRLEKENKVLFDFKEEVFNLLDGKIKRGEEAIEGGKRIGANVGAMGFYIEMLKILRKELYK